MTCAKDVVSAARQVAVVQGSEWPSGVWTLVDVAHDLVTPADHEPRKQARVGAKSEPL
jgi:hypothetical protein